MKNDTLDNTIDLDNMFKSEEKIEPTVVGGAMGMQPIEPEETVDIDINKIVAEWSYRLSSGYPKVKDGIFEESDVQILNQVLNELYPGVNFDTFILLEARPHEHTDLKYIPLDASQMMSRWQGINIDPEVLVKFPLYNTTPVNISKKDRFVLMGNVTLDDIDYATAADLLANKQATVWKSDAFNNLYFIIKVGKTRLVTQLKGAAATDTDVKEGLVVVMYDSNITTPFTPQTFQSHIADLQQTAQASDSLDATAKKRVIKYFDKIKFEFSREIVNTLNETLSQALAMRLAYGEGFRIDRDYVFKRIRDVASSATGLPADKWCPGDVYLIADDASLSIENAVNDVVRSKNIADLNVLFINDWGDLTSKAGACIVACSLKMAKAQAGKAKSYLKQMGKADMEYNVSPDEAKMNLKGIIEGIIRLRGQLAKVLKRNDTCKFNYSATMDPKTLSKMPEKLLREKYAALKIITALLGKDGSDVDDNLLGAIAYGMSLSNVNPSFFKVVGNPSGKPARVEHFKAGDTIKFFSKDPGQLSIVDVNDNDTANAVQFKCKMQMGEEILDVLFQSRSNGLTQATLELQKVKPIANV
jgi:aspartate 1-decarboxylase